MHAQGLKLNSCLIDFSLYLELLISNKIHCLIFQIKVWKTTLCFLRSKKKTRYFILNPTWKAFFTTEVQQIVHYTKIFIKTEEKKSFINSSLIAIQIKNFNLWLIKDNGRILFILYKNVCNCWYFFVQTTVFISERNWVFASNINFLIPKSLQSDCVNLWYFKLYYLIYQRSTKSCC